MWSRCSEQFCRACFGSRCWEQDLGEVVENYVQGYFSKEECEVGEVSSSEDKHGTDAGRGWNGKQV